VKGLLELGRPAVSTLAAALGRAETSLAARELIVDGLGRLGPPRATRCSSSTAWPRPPRLGEARRVGRGEGAPRARGPPVGRRTAAAEKIRGRSGEAP